MTFAIFVGRIHCKNIMGAIQGEVNCRARLAHKPNHWNWRVVISPHWNACVRLKSWHYEFGSMLRHLGILCVSPVRNVHCLKTALKLKCICTGHFPTRDRPREMQKYWDDNGKIWSFFTEQGGTISRAEAKLISPWSKIKMLAFVIENECHNVRNMDYKCRIDEGSLYTKNCVDVWFFHEHPLNLIIVACWFFLVCHVCSIFHYF